MAFVVNTRIYIPMLDKEYETHLKGSLESMREIQSHPKHCDVKYGLIMKWKEILHQKEERIL